jgi:hypothetical protein
MFGTSPGSIVVPMCTARRRGIQSRTGSMLSSQFTNRSADDFAPQIEEQGMLGSNHWYWRLPRIIIGLRLMGRLLPVHEVVARQFDASYNYTERRTHSRVVRGFLANLKAGIEQPHRSGSCSRALRLCGSAGAHVRCGWAPVGGAVRDGDQRHALW